MNKPKVSIITPCYNGEEHLEYFLDSLLNQDYPNVEFFFVDDGSKDKTKDIFYSYIPKLEKKGWNTKYVRKNHGGTASAINAALPLISGKYFIWPDSDDILYPSHISEKVNFMEEHSEYAISYAPSDVVKFENLDKITGKYDFIPDDNMFENIIQGKALVYTLGTIVRTDALFDTIPNKKIYEGQAGQNCQIQMPVLYSYKCGYINKPLAKRVIRKNSHYQTTSKKFLYRRYHIFMTWVMTILSLKYAGNFEKFILILRTLLRNLKIVFVHYSELIFSIKKKKTKTIITVFGIKIKFGSK